MRNQEAFDSAEELGAEVPTRQAELQKLFSTCVRPKLLGSGACQVELEAAAAAERALQAARPHSAPFLRALQSYGEW